MKNFKQIDKQKFNFLLNKMRDIQQIFLSKFQVDDIWSNSKIFEIIIADNLGHNLIPGHSGSKDATFKGKEFEYKHFKETSSNHSWTFNDYSDTTIEKLKNTYCVIFSHINDKNFSFPGNFDWYYEVSGYNVSQYLEKYTKSIQNSRKMINISPNQIESRLKIKKTYTKTNVSGIYREYLRMIFNVAKEIEYLTDTDNVLTSNKFWEVVVAVQLNHNVNSEQGGRSGAHDAYDKNFDEYEYKVSKTYSWNFQDISENVLQKYINGSKSIILAVVDKENIRIKNIFSCNTYDTISVLKRKLNEKIKRFEEQGKSIRRKQVGLSKGDLDLINHQKII